jgi:excisionase family DNA binding protein
MAKLKLEVKIQGAYTVEEAAEKLHIGIATVWRWIRKHKLSSFKVTVGMHSRTLVLAKEVKELQKGESSPGKRALAGTKGER